jgi:hypothetical protein
MIPRALEAEILRLHHTEHWPVGTIACWRRSKIDPLSAVMPI